VKKRHACLSPARRLPATCNGCLAALLIRLRQAMTLMMLTIALVMETTTVMITRMIILTVVLRKVMHDGK
jgi:hypothetical protein